MKENQTVAQFLGITKFPYFINNDQGRIIYSESSKGFWEKREYDTNGKETRFDNSKGFWWKSKYDAKGNQTYFEDSKGFWWKSKYDAKGKETRFDNSRGYWEKSEYDAKGNEIYYENSYGHIIDNRPKQVELTLADIASKLNIPLDQLRIKE